MGVPILSTLIFLPLLGAIFALFFPRENVGFLRTWAVVVSLVVFFVSIGLWIGFDPTTYSTASTTFSVTLQSDKHGAQAWTGQIGAGSLSGQLVWTRPDGKVSRYNFTGSRNTSLSLGDVADDD